MAGWRQTQPGGRIAFAGKHGQTFSRIILSGRGLSFGLRDTVEGRQRLRQDRLSVPQTGLPAGHACGRHGPRDAAHVLLGAAACCLRGCARPDGRPDVEGPRGSLRIELGARRESFQLSEHRGGFTSSRDPQGVNNPASIGPCRCASIAGVVLHSSGMIHREKSAVSLYMESFYAMTTLGAVIMPASSSLAVSAATRGVRGGAGRRESPAVAPENRGCFPDGP